MRLRRFAPRFDSGGVTAVPVNVGLVLGANAAVEGDYALEFIANADIVFGFAMNYTISGMSGDDTTYGGEVMDTAVFAASVA